MRYEALRYLKMYEAQQQLIFPKGERVGYGNAVFIMSNSWKNTMELINNNMIDYRMNLYRFYYTDGIYKEKLGRKRIVKNLNQTIKKDFYEYPLQDKLRFVSHQSKTSILKSNPNVIVDLGIWFEYYGQFSLKLSTRFICEEYIRFISKRISDMVFGEYNKYILIDIADWFKNKTLSFSRKSLNDPVSILLFTSYKFPEFIKYLPDVDFIFMDSTSGQILKINSKSFTKDQYTILKSRLSRFTKLKNLESLNEEESSSEDDISEEKKIKIEKNKSEILSTLRKNLTGEKIHDIPSDIIENDSGYNKYNIEFDNSVDDEIDLLANEFLDKNTDLAEVDDISEVVEDLESYLKNKIYISSYMPERTEKEKANIEKFSKVQNNVIGSMSLTDMKSKIIDESDFQGFVNTSNPNIVKSKYVNFNKSYNNKKLVQDIDNMIGSMSTATNKVFVVDKKEEDTSDLLNLKKTYTYILNDVNGKKMTLKFDIPILIDDTFMWINGSKKILQHQRILKPIVHTRPDTVQIVSSYNKIFITRKGQLDKLVSSLKKYLIDNQKHFELKLGNTIAKNSSYLTRLDYDIFAKNIYSLKIGDNVILFDIDKVLEELSNRNIAYKKNNTEVVIGYNEKLDYPIIIKDTDDVSERLISFFTKEERAEFSKIKMNKQLMFAEAKILEVSIPIVLFMLFCNGFTEVMQKTGIEHKFITFEQAKEYDIYEWENIRLKDGVVVWKRYPMENSLLFNGLRSIPTELYTFEELDSKETYIYILTQFYQYANMAFNLDQFKDFILDPITKEVLNDFEYPTDLVELLWVAVKMLTTNSYLSENSLHNMRIRSNEIIAHHVYKEITNAYNRYRKTTHKKNPTSISIKQNAIIANLLSSKLIEDNSVLNPVLELEKNRSVTFKGESGINLENSLTIDKRAYDESMLGVLGISSSPDANIGVLRQLTLEPTITSTRGYIDIKGLTNVEELSSANLLTPAELLTPLGVQHDDPTRTSMAYKQSKYMLLVSDAEPVMIGNKVEAIIPYHTSDEFSVVAKNDGIIVDVKNDIVVIKYKDGKFQSIDTSPQIKKNSSSGFYIESKLTCNKKMGDTIKKGEVVAYNARAFTKNKDDLSASMNLGVLTKIAIIPNWDIFEDSAPVTKSLSDRLSSDIIMDKDIVLTKNTFVQSIVKVGDIVNTGDPLIVFDQASESSPLQDKFLESIREDMGESIINSIISTVKSDYSGTVMDIKIYSTVDLDELSPTLREITETYYKRISTKEKILNKYKNPDDSNFYKSYNLITESTSKVIPNIQGKVKGNVVGDGVLIVFYIKYTDKLGKGDKICSEFALKSICSHVIEEGLEPYSQFRPDEEISSLVAPLSITARKTPSIFLAMFGNKLLIEFKRYSKEKYFK